MYFSHAGTLLFSSRLEEVFLNIVLFRHAERDSFGGSNPGLSAKGLKQAQEISKSIQHNLLPSPSAIWVSPLLRTQMTMQPVAKSLNIELTITEELNERQEFENKNLFSHRIQGLIDRVADQNHSLFICSHLDWIDEALTLIPADTDLLQAKFQNWRPAQYMQFSIEAGLWKLTNNGGFLC
jgi:phosphohistidine phosphatase SixA